MYNPLCPLQVKPTLSRPELVKKNTHTHTKHIISSVLSKKVENFLFLRRYVYTYIHMYTNIYVRMFSATL